MRLWRRARGWLLFGGATVLGAGCGVAAGYLLSDRLAGTVVGVVTAVAGVLGARGKALLESRSARRAALPGQVLAGRLARVRELTDPLVLGVHPAAADGTGRVPPYVLRDFEHGLDEALRSGGFVLLSGESTAGKSRAAYEAMRRRLPEHTVVAPADRESIASIVEVVLEHRRCVVWLDDIERFLGAPGLTVPAVSRMLAGGAVLLGTIRAAELDRFGARHESALDTASRDGWRTATDVLRLAVEIPVPRRWSAPELARARTFGADTRIRSALATIQGTDTFGLAELLADGPELVRDWRDAWRAGGHPRAAALVTAAVDCRRAGRNDPMPVALLDRLSEPYLAARGGPTLRPEPLAEALAWATEPARGASSLLMPTGRDDHYLAFDYLIDLPGEPVPLSTWTTLIESSDPEQALRIGLAARQFARFDIAATAFALAADAGVPGADIELADEVGASGHPERAVRLLTEALAARPPHAPETVRIRTALARYTTPIDQPRSDRMFAELLADCHRELGPDHPDTLAVRRQAAFHAGQVGDPARARDLLAELLAYHRERSGLDHPDTLQLRHVLALWVGRAGDPATALAMLTEVLADRLRVQGDKHPNVLSARFHIAVWTGNSGQPKRAVELFGELLPDSVRLLGEHHPHTVSTRYRLGLSAREVGRTEEAVRQLTIVHREWVDTFGADHQGVARVRDLLDELGANQI